jgi:hypothetical protein
MKDKNGIKKEYCYFVKIVRLQHERKTSDWDVWDNTTGRRLGRIGWHSPFRQYIYLSLIDFIYTQGHIKDINNFMTMLAKQLSELNKKLRAKKNETKQS